MSYIVKKIVLDFSIQKKSQQANYAVMIKWQTNTYVVGFIGVKNIIEFDKKVENILLDFHDKNPLDFTSEIMFRCSFNCDAIITLKLANKKLFVLLYDKKREIKSGIDDCNKRTSSHVQTGDRYACTLTSEMLDKLSNGCRFSHTPLTFQEKGNSMDGTSGYLSPDDFPTDDEKDYE